MQIGINKLIYAFDSEYIPGVDECTMAPYDTMHVECDGLLRMEMAYLLYMLITKRKYFTLVQLNAAIKSFPWPKGHRMPGIEPKVVEGAKGRVPRWDAHTSPSHSNPNHYPNPNHHPSPNTDLILVLPINSDLGSNPEHELNSITNLKPNLNPNPDPDPRSDAHLFSSASQTLNFALAR